MVIKHGPVFDTEYMFPTAIMRDLNELPYAQGVRHSGTAGCLDGTRVTFLHKITEFLSGVAVTAHGDSPRIVLLTGAAGSGKSAIASTIAQQFEEAGQLVSSFFFNRNDDSKRRPNEVFPTIARDFADHDPAFKERLWFAVKDCRGIRQTTCISEQFTHFILNPAKDLAIHDPHIIVIDAVDECYDDDSQPDSRGKFLQALEAGLSDNSGLSKNLRIFMTSRPDKDIMQWRRPLKFVEHIRMEDIDSSKADISAFIERNLSGVKSDLEKEWPQMGWRDALLDKAGSSFIWASTACEFVKATGKGGVSHRNRLKQLLDGTRGLKKLDSLYLTILRKTVDEEDDDEMDRFRAVMGMILGGKVPLSLTALNDLLDPNAASSEHVAESVAPFLGSLLVRATKGNRDGPIQPLHLSLRDFLSDPKRSEGFFIDMKRQHFDLAIACLDIMERVLKRDICGLNDDFSRNPTVGEVREVVPHYQALRYACRYCFDHLLDFGTCEDGEASKKLLEISRRISNFLRSKALHWVEFLSLTNQLESGVGSLEKLGRWLQVNHPFNEKTAPPPVVHIFSHLI